jgi:hypothetical protein
VLFMPFGKVSLLPGGAAGVRRADFGQPRNNFANDKNG